MNLVLDTNILVSALWSPGKNASMILRAALSRKHTVCYDYRILEEYDRTLHYRKFPFSEWEIYSVLESIIKTGFSIVAEPLPDIPFTDESDRKFYEVSKFCDAILITGNKKHYPDEPDIMTMSDFCRKYQ